MRFRRWLDSDVMFLAILVVVLSIYGMVLVGTTRGQNDQLENKIGASSNRRITITYAGSPDSSLVIEGKCLSSLTEYAHRQVNITCETTSGEKAKQVILLGDMDNFRVEEMDKGTEIPYRTYYKIDGGN